MAVTEYKLQCGICTLLKLECKMQLSLMKYGNLLLEKQQAVGCQRGVQIKTYCL